MDNDAYTELINDSSLKDDLGQFLLRDDLLQSILGSDSHEILYWAGKYTARKYRLANYDQLELFFKQFNLGNLTIRKEATDQISWELSGNVVEKRLSLFSNPDFYLETGLIAENCQFINRRKSEAEIEKINAKKGIVDIICYLGSKTTNDLEPNSKIFKLQEDSQKSAVSSDSTETK